MSRSGHHGCPHPAVGAMLEWSQRTIWHSVFTYNFSYNISRHSARYPFAADLSERLKPIIRKNFKTSKKIREKSNRAFQNIPLSHNVQKIPL